MNMNFLTIGYHRLIDHVLKCVDKWSKARIKFNNHTVWSNQTECAGAWYRTRNSTKFVGQFRTVMSDEVSGFRVKLDNICYSNFAATARTLILSNFQAPSSNKGSKKRLTELMVCRPDCGFNALIMARKFEAPRKGP